MTTLVPQNVDLEKQVADGTITLEDLLTHLAKAERDLVAEPTAEPVDSQQEAPKPGKVIALPENTRVALKTIPVELSSVVLPSEVRTLTLEEATRLVPLYVELGAAEKALEKAKEAIKGAFHNHFDAQAPEGSLIDKHEHAITEGELRVPGLANRILRSFVGGKAAGITESDLAELDVSGDLDHADYLALTVQLPPQRTLAPEEKVMAVLRKKPHLIKVLKKKARLTPLSTRITSPKA